MKAKSYLKIHLLLFNVLSYTVKADQCTCKEISIQQDCLTTKCLWLDYQCINPDCGLRTREQCITYNSSPYRISQIKCIYDDLKKVCIPYDDQCSHVILGKLNKAQESILTCNKFLCGYDRVTQTCVQTKDCALRSEVDCYGFYNGNGLLTLCIWKNESCVAFDSNTECKLKSDAKMCTLFGACIWKNQVCKNLTCEDQSSGNCQNIRQGDSLLQCEIKNGFCQSGNNTNYNSETCLLQTQNQYTWNRQQCRKCFGQMIGQFIFLIIYI